MPKRSNRLDARLDLIGLDELERKLKGLGKAVAFKSLDKAANAAGTQIVRNARQAAPVDEGHLKKAIKKKAGKKGRHSASTMVGVDKRYEVTEDGRKIRPVRYAHLVEFGVGPHEISTRGSGVLVDDSFNVLGSTVNHPGQGAQPFLGPSITGANKTKAIRAMKAKLLKEIARLTR